MLVRRGVEFIGCRSAATVTCEESWPTKCASQMDHDMRVYVCVRGEVGVRRRQVRGGEQ